MFKLFKSNKLKIEDASPPVADIVDFIKNNDKGSRLDWIDSVVFIYRDTHYEIRQPSIIDGDKYQMVCLWRSRTNKSYAWTEKHDLDFFTEGELELIYQEVAPFLKEKREEKAQQEKYKKRQKCIEWFSNK